MILVDAHVHASQYWFEPVETLLFQMQRHGVAKAVLVQHFGNYHNQYVLECIHNYPGLFVAVVLVDTQRADATGTLEKWAEKGATGVRLRANERSPGPDSLAIWRKASELGLVVSGFGTADMFAADEFRRLVEELPNLKIVLEHMAGAEPEPQTDYNLFEKVLVLAEYPNIYIKLHGFGELLPRPMPFSTGATFHGPPRVVRMAYEVFGRQRMMWGSNFSSCSKLEGYTNALRLPMKRTPFFSEEDKEWIFGKTALSVWKMA
ncbi:amidohydrolase family protein [Chloroflexota bacterium]